MSRLIRRSSLPLLGARPKHALLKQHLTTTPGAKKIAVMGAGVAGLQTINVLRAHGHDVTCFEKTGTVGGVWASNYVNFGLQVPKQLYEFPDFPFTEVAAGVFPKGEIVQRYIQRYVTAHGLEKCVKLNTEVTACTQLPDKRWAVTTTGAGKQQQPQTDTFDYLIVTSGMYNAPNLPTFPGQNTVFQGKVVHTSKLTDNAAAMGKHVVVVGGAKSALDVAVETAKVSARSTLVFSQAHWAVPPYIAGIIPFQYVFLSRFGQALVSWYKGAWPGAPASVAAAHSVLSVVMGPIFRVVEALFAFQQGHYGVYRPADDIAKDFYGYVQRT